MPDIYVNKYGPWIKRLRGEIAATQTELGSLLGVTKKTVAGWEAGPDEPNASRAIEMARLARARGTKAWFVQAALHTIGLSASERQALRLL